MADTNYPKPVRADLACLVQRLLDLRDALEETALALTDFQCTLDSDQCRAAQLLTLQVIERARERGYSAGDGAGDGA